MGTVFSRYSRMLRMVALVGVLAAAMAWPAPKSVVKSYAYLTIMKNCYGEEVLKGYMTKFKDAAAMCSGKPTSISDMPAVRQYLMQLRAQSARPNYIPVPIPMFGGRQGGDLSNFFQQQRPQGRPDRGYEHVPRLRQVYATRCPQEPHPEGVWRVYGLHEVLQG